MDLSVKRCDFHSGLCFSRCSKSMLVVNCKVNIKIDPGQAGRSEFLLIRVGDSPVVRAFPQNGWMSEPIFTVVPVLDAHHLVPVSWLLPPFGPLCRRRTVASTACRETDIGPASMSLRAIWWSSFDTRPGPSPSPSALAESPLVVVSPCSGSPSHCCGRTSGRIGCSKRVG